MVVSGRGYWTFLCDTRDGGRVRPIPASEAGWALKMNDAGTVTVGLPVMARETVKLDLRTSTASVRQCLGIAYDETILECGPIWGRKYDPDKESLALTAAGMWSIFDHRKAVPGSYLVDGGVPSRAVWTITKGSLGSIARELVRDSLMENPYMDGMAGVLNMYVPDDVPGTAHTRTYYGYDMAWIGTRLRELTQVTNGPDIRFRPRFVPGDVTRVEWLMEYGTNAQPLLQRSGPDLRWDVSLSKSGAVHLSVDEDATDLAARAWINGPGQGAAKKIKYQTSLDLVGEGWPWTEVEDSNDSETLGVLQQYADQLMKRNKWPWLTWDLTVRADVAPRLGTYQPGDWVQLTIPAGHPQVPAGTVRTRILAMAGSGADQKVKLTVAPMQGRY